MNWINTRLNILVNVGNNNDIYLYLLDLEHLFSQMLRK